LERQGPRLAALLLAVSVGLVMAAPVAGAQQRPIQILVVKEHGVGSASLAQPFVDRFVALAAEDNGWPAAKGQYLSNRDAAAIFIKEHSPHYGILSLAAFLALRQRYQMEVVGRVASTLAGGEQYFIVSQSARDLAGCKGHRLASDHFTDTRFVEKVIARGAFELADFELVKNRRPLQSLRQVMGGEAECALLDDAQLEALKHLKGADSVHVLWKSHSLPPMAVVAFTSAPTAQRKTFKANLSKICEGIQNTVCAEVGIRALSAARTSDYAEVMALYGR